LAGKRDFIKIFSATEFAGIMQKYKEIINFKITPTRVGSKLILAKLIFSPKVKQKTGRIALLNPLKGGSHPKLCRNALLR